MSDWSPRIFEDMAYRMTLANLDAMDRLMTAILEARQGPGYWERQLALAIEERRLRNQPRRLARLAVNKVRNTWAYSRYATALAVLRGRHDCGYDW